MNPLLIAMAAACVLLVVALCVTLWSRARSGDADLERRLRLVAAALAGGATAVDDADGGLFRHRSDKFWLFDRIERRFSMLEGRQALPKAVALGFLLALAVGVAALLMRFGILSALVVPVAWVAGSWGLLRMWDASRRADFVKRFPEVVDHVVRLTRTGLPPVEAISVVAEEAHGPVKRVMQEVSDDLSSGLDPEVVLRGTAARVRIPEFTLFSAAALPATHHRRRHLGRARQSLGDLARPDGGGDEGARLHRADAHHAMGVDRGPGGGGDGPELPQPQARSRSCPGTRRCCAGASGSSFWGC